MTDSTTYMGPVAFQDGWHWTVVTDEADKARTVAIAQANLTHAESRDDKTLLKVARANLAEANAHSYDVPGERLVHDPETDTYRLATADDTESHNAKYSQRFASVELEDGGAGLRVTADEFTEIQKLLADRRGE